MLLFVNQWAQFTCTWRLWRWGAAPLCMLLLLYQWAQFTCTWKPWVRSSSSAHAPTSAPVSSVQLYLEAVGEEQLLGACSYFCTSELCSHVPGGCVSEEQLLCACSYFCTSELSLHVPGGCGWGAAPLRMLLLLYQWAQFTCTWRLWVRSSSSAHAPTSVPVSSVHLYLEAVCEEQLLCTCSYTWACAQRYKMFLGSLDWKDESSRIHILFCSKTIYFSRLSICRQNQFFS